jgi:hypothetical protein
MASRFHRECGLMCEAFSGNVVNNLFRFFRININIVLYGVNSSSSTNADLPNSIESLFISIYPTNRPFYNICFNQMIYSLKDNEKST